MEKKQQPLKAIRAFCMDCVGSYNEITLCPCTNCALHDFRFGKNPFRKSKNLTEEQREAIAKRMANARAARAMEDEEDDED